MPSFYIWGFGDSVLRQDVPDLQSDREEGNTRLLLHAKLAAETHDCIIVKTPSTDVFILCIAMQKTIGKNLLLMTGTGNKFCFIDTPAVADALGADLCTCLLGFHNFTGTVYCTGI